ncbi:uracil-DNA glycosylase [Chlamydiifrater phoenicopteri]|uniref:uracil-DNA glycosylase n=1 Tax=Chlamydiifrater phoenicopteri TaxID=2681469 RepID=UPI001BCE4970|nr:uracil-DNA glycosylase [Chlamydiifrater phoenicopteri]
MNVFLDFDKLDHSWRERLQPVRNSPIVGRLEAFLALEYEKQQIFPKREDIFRALKLTPFDKVQVVILGQDPYHGEGQAHGLSFSVPDGVPLPASLVNIFRELKEDIGVVNTKGCLQSWAAQGVLLLNSVLTVRKGQPRSHAGRGWEFVTDAIISELVNREDRLIFVLWGSDAKRKCDILFRSPQRHAILSAPHPSPLSAYRGFFGSSPFSKINYLLRKQNKPMINWKLP